MGEVFGGVRLPEATVLDVCVERCVYSPRFGRPRTFCHAELSGWFMSRQPMAMARATKAGNPRTR